jgi:hypothetical protein
MFKPLMLLLILLTCLPPISARQDEDDNARGIFIRTRKNTVRQDASSRPGASPARPPVRRKRRVPPAAIESKSNAHAPQPQQSFVGLGYTLYLKGDDGGFTSVNPDRIFRTGQAVRLLVESNVDGYLYVLHQENDGPAKLMFPCSLAWDGDNHISAHRPLFISPVTEMRFTGDPAVETLTLIVSRNPIQSLPVGRQLASARCDTPVSEVALDSILRYPCQCSADQRVAEGLQMPSNALQRDMEMVASDPEPNHIFVNKNPHNDILLTRIKLNHR